MTEANSSSSAPASKPTRPEGFPLFAHATKRWAKKIKGKMHYFGPWSDPDGALKLYNQQKDRLHAGLRPVDPEVSAGVTIAKLCDLFLDAKLCLQEAGELSMRTWTDYKAATDIIVEHFGKTRRVDDIDPSDFGVLRAKLAKGWSPVTLGNCIQRIRVVFKFASDNALTSKPMSYGQGFKRPSKKTLRLEKNRQGAKLFNASEVRRILGEADGQLRAMVLLGLNCGFGNSDCAGLPLTAVDLEAGRIDFPRPKTGISRSCPLWGETVEALREVLAKRREPKDKADSGLVFITKYGLSWGKDTSDNPISKEMSKLLKRLGINSHRNFYTLRHTFRTVADEAKDQPAIDHIMGHESAHMSSTYRETGSEFWQTRAADRLAAVVNVVRNWLFPSV